MYTQGIIRVIHVLWQIMAKLGAAAKIYVDAGEKQSITK